MSSHDEKLLNRATRRIGYGDLAGARQILERVEPASLDHPRSLLQLAHAWLAAGMAHKAYAGLRLLAGMYHQRQMFLEEVAVLRHLLGFAADTLDLHVDLARAYQRIGVLGEVERHYLAALQEALEGPRRERLRAEVEAFEPKSDALRASLSSRETSPQEAPPASVAAERPVAVAAAVRASTPSSPLADEKGTLRPGDTERAYRVLTRLLAANPDDIDARECLADVFRWAGSRDGVVEQLRELVRIGGATRDSRTELWRRELDELQARPEAKALGMITRAAAVSSAVTHDDIGDALRSAAEAQGSPE